MLESGSPDERTRQRVQEGHGPHQPPLLPGTDTCYVLSFAVIMLNTSLHNPNVRDKPGLERFVAMNRGINEGGDLPEDLLRVSAVPAPPSSNLVLRAVCSQCVSSPVPSFCSSPWLVVYVSAQALRALSPVSSENLTDFSIIIPPSFSPSLLPSLLSSVFLFLLESEQLIFLTLEQKAAWAWSR